MKTRTKARGVALQVLYELDVVQHPIGRVLKERIDAAALDDGQTTFIRELVLGVHPLIPKLDAYISEHAPEWPLEQVAIIDRNIIRLALWEFAVTKNTPLKVAINEAVELAKTYGSDSAARFVNGVLGSLADRQNEIQQAFQSDE